MIRLFTAQSSGYSSPVKSGGHRRYSLKFQAEPELLLIISPIQAVTMERQRYFTLSIIAVIFHTTISTLFVVSAEAIDAHCSGADSMSFSSY